MTEFWTRRAAMEGLLMSGAVAGFATRGTAGLLDGLGLTKLLGNASDSALTKLALPDGFYRDTAIRILLPGTGGKLARKLMQGGDKLGLTTKLTKSLNDAASLAAGEAKPVFRNAISGMKITDVPGLVADKRGGTSFLERTAGADLGTKVRPLISTALGKVGAFDQLAKLGSAGSLLGALGLSSDKLTDHVTQQAMHGIFSYMGSEEEALRGNPTKILGKVL